MQGVLEKAYNGFLEVIEGFANCSTDVPLQTKPDEVAKPSDVSIPDYAYPCDNYINTVLDNRLVRQTLRNIAAKYYGNQMGEIIQISSELTPQNYPKLHTNYQYCCTTLNVTNPPKVFITSNLSGVNALSVEVEDASIILLSYMSVISLNDRAQRFLLGHELGHIQLGHMVVHTLQGLLQDLNTRAELLGPIITDLIDVPLNRWYRTSEFTADRAGYLCCEDLDAVERLFIHLGMDPNPSAYMEYMELEASHPTLHTRWGALREYIDKKQR